MVKIGSLKVDLVNKVVYDNRIIIKIEMILVVIRTAIRVHPEN